MSVPVTPVIPKDFNPDWAGFVLKDWFIKNERDVDKIKISKVEALLNGQQGLLSTTFIVDVFFQEGDGEEEKKSIFVKIPLIGEASKNFKQVNVREYEMFTNVLPELQKYLGESCDGFFCMGVPEVIYCYYSGDEVHDAFIIENLVDSGFLTCTTEDLHVDNNGRDYIKATLETLSQLHGTGLQFKKSLNGNKGVLERFPKIEEQIQIKDILKNQESRNFLRKHFAAFIRYLEETDPELKNITSYMKKMESYLFKILKVLEDSGVRHLNTLCHGDAKPNNFMFRKIDIDFDDDDDEELKDLKCEGVESMLIDWQGGFLGSLCNDLMWCMFPFFEVNSHDKELYEFAFRHYYDELKNVLQTFNSDLKDFCLPEEFSEFRSLVRRGFVLEFLIVTVLRPVMNITNPEEVMKWYKKLEKYDRMKAKGGVYALLARKKPKLPPQESIFQNPRYMEFLQFYFKIATALGAFQELGLIYFELMKDGLFKETTKPEPEKPKAFTKPWFKNMMNISCVRGEKESDTEEEDDSYDIEENKDLNKQEITVQEEIPASTEDEEVDIKENLYEPIAELEEEIPEEVVVREVREPTPPDPLRTLAAQLHQQFVGYKATFNAFENVMDDYKPEPIAEEESAEIEATINRASESHKTERKLSTEEEIALVRKMSNESAWSHVVSEVMKEKKQSRDEAAESKDKNNGEYSKIERKSCHIEEKSAVQKTMSGNEILNHVIEVTKEKKVHGESNVAKETKSVQARLKCEENADKNATHATEDSTQMMKRISMDIDISNQKVLETIEFLSSTSSNQDEETISNITSENDVSNATEICTKNTQEPARKTAMTKNDFVESLVNDSLTDAKHIVAYTKKSESEFEKKATENILKKETLETNLNECAKSEEPADTRNSILAWLSLSSHPKEEETINGNEAPIVENIKEMEEIKEDDIKETSEQQNNHSDQIQIKSSENTEEGKKEVDTRSSILNWLNLGKTNNLEKNETEKEKDPVKERTPKPQLERTFSNDLDDCKSEVENIQNNIMGLGNEATTENGFAELKTQILSDETELGNAISTPVKPPRTSISEKNSEPDPMLEESEPAPALTQPTWANIAQKPKRSVDLEPQLPHEDVFPLQSKKLSTIVIAVDDLKAPKTVKEVDDGFRIVKTKSESKVQIEEIKLKVENKSPTLTEEANENNVMTKLASAQPEKCEEETPSMAQMPEKQSENVVAPLLLPPSADKISSKPTMVVSDVEDNKEDVEGHIIVKSEKESQICQDETYDKTDSAVSVSVSVEQEETDSFNSKIQVMEVNNDISKEAEDLKDYYQVVGNYLATSALGQSGSEAPVQLETGQDVTREKKNIIDEEDFKVELPLLSLEPPTWASIAEKPKQSSEAEPELGTASDVIILLPHKLSTIIVAVEDKDGGVAKTETDEDGFAVVKSKRENKVCMESQLLEENVKSATVIETKKLEDEKSNMLAIETDQPYLSLEAPTWASIAEKPKQSGEVEPELSTASDVIILPPHKVSTIVVAVEDKDDGAAKNCEDEDGFAVVKSKRESKVCIEKQPNQLLEEDGKTIFNKTKTIEDKQSNILGGIKDENALVTEIKQFMEAEEKQSEALDGENISTQDAISHDHKVEEGDSTMDKRTDPAQPILPLEAPTWASIADKPQQCSEVEPELTVASDVIALPANKVSTLVVAIENENNLTEDEEKDPEGFTNVKSKRASKIFGENDEKQKFLEEYDALLGTEIEKSKEREGEKEEKESITLESETIQSPLGKEIQNCTDNVETLSDMLDNIMNNTSLKTETNPDKPETNGTEEEENIKTVESQQQTDITSMPPPKAFEIVVSVENEVTTQIDKKMKIFSEIEERPLTKLDSRIKNEESKSNDLITEINCVMENEESQKNHLDCEKDENALVTEINRFVENEKQNNQLNCEKKENKLDTEKNHFMKIEEKQTVHVNHEKEENRLVTKINHFVENEKPKDQLEFEKEENKLVTEINHFMNIEEKQTVNVNSEKVEDELVTDISHFMKTEEKKSKIEENVTENTEKRSPMTNGTITEASHVLDSLETVLSRKSESRLSVKKRKQRNSMKSSEQLPDLIDSEDNPNPESRRKSREVFDFYVNAIDGDTKTSKSVPLENGLPSRTACSETKSVEHIVIENILKSIPKDMTTCSRLDENKTENGNGSSENGKEAPEPVLEKVGRPEREDENGYPNTGSTSTSGANTLRRSWKRQNSKKKRKSQHIL